MTLFLVSGVVVLLGGLFNNYMVGQFKIEYAKRLAGSGLDGSSQVDVPYGVSASVIESWLGRVADTAANLPAMVLTQPAGFQRHAARLTLAAGMADKNFLQLRKAFWKIGEELRGNLSFIAARAQNARN